MVNGIPIEDLTRADKFRPKFLEKRRMGLSYFLKSVSLLLNSFPDTDIS
jgi:hypothetical protein